MSYNYNGFDPLRTRMNDLMQRKAAIDQEINNLQQIPAMPININNNMTPSHMVQYDFNGRWVENEEQAKQIANSNLPLILFDNNNPVFYMKEVDGTLKKYKFEEIIPEPPKDVIGERISNLENQLSTLINALGGANTSSDTNTQSEVKTPSKATKEPDKGGKK